MYSMLKKRNYPGYLYMIDNGATTTWEHWNGNRSHIHNCYNGIGSWFYQAIGGIQPAEDVPAYQKITIQPQVPEGITWAKVFKVTPYGKIGLNWELNNNRFDMEISIPVGMEAKVLLPRNLDGFVLTKTNIQTENEQQDGITIKSGRYRLKYIKP